MDVFFLHKFQNIIDMEKELAAADKIDSDLYIRAKKMGFLDKTIEQLSGKDISDVKRLPVYKMVDTCAAEFEAETPITTPPTMMRPRLHLRSGKKKILVLGSGPIRMVRASSSTTARFTLSGRCRSWAARPLSSTTTRRPFPLTLTPQTVCTSSR